jgi:hypothetical protein
VKTVRKNICWENALKTISGFAPAVGYANCTDWPTVDIVALGATIAFTTSPVAGSTQAA